MGMGMGGYKEKGRKERTLSNLTVFPPTQLDFFSFSAFLKRDNRKRAGIQPQLPRVSAEATRQHGSIAWASPRGHSSGYLQSNLLLITCVFAITSLIAGFGLNSENKLVLEVGSVSHES